MKIGLYPGTFDPFTAGHMDVLERAASLMDEVVVALLINTTKAPVFTTKERQEQIAACVEAAGLHNVRTACFDGLLVDYARQIGARYVVRGLRAVMDFEYEFQINAMNRKLDPALEALYFMADPSHAYISSSIVREICTLGGPIDGLVPEAIKSSIIERLANK